MSELYDSSKLLNNLNVAKWDHHLREKLSAYPIMGKAIRKGIPFKATKPTVDDLFEDGGRMYTHRVNSINLDSESRKDFLSACIMFEKTEVRRNEEEAKICALITSSFNKLWLSPQKQVLHELIPKNAISSGIPCSQSRN